MPSSLSIYSLAPKTKIIFQFASGRASLKTLSFCSNLSQSSHFFTLCNVSLVVAKNGSLYASALWWKSGPIYCYAESKKASLGGAAVSRQIPSSSKNWSLSHSHEGAHCSTLLSTKFHRPAFHVDAAHVDMSLPYGDTPGYETPAGTILISHFPPNVIIWLFLVK